MRVLVLGVDGYLGWSLVQYLARYGHIVSGIDNLLRRDKWTKDIGSDSILPILSLEERVSRFREIFGKEHFNFPVFDIKTNAGVFDNVNDTINKFSPDCVVNLAQMPSAPYSMISHGKCLDTHINNISTTLAVIWSINESKKNIPIVMIGTAGEYGTPGIEIAEGEFTVCHKGRTTQMLFPRMTPASFYHATKCHSSIDIERACVWWGLSATDIMQSVVYGTRHRHMAFDEGLNTRFDVCEVFGTAINRFVAQAVAGIPLTVYGKGTQKRGFLPLGDSMECLRLIIENPPKQGEYRVINQYDQVYELNSLARIVQEVASDFDIKAIVKNIENPRHEQMDHFYSVERKKLLDLGYVPKGEIKEEIAVMFSDIMPHVGRINLYKERLTPVTKWGRRA